MSPAAATAERAEIVGRITGVFGVRGWVRVFSYTDPPANILRYGPWQVGDGAGTLCRVSTGALHGRGVVAHLAGVDDRETARALIGSVIRVPRERFGRAGGNEYFWSDLVGLEVVNQAGVGLGRVTELFETGANDVLVVQGDRRRLLPFVTGTVIRAVDLDAGCIEVDWDADF
ncbi:MAG: ribosome maturation factor RimM [Gammaproteobacteria bacterium]|nr:ribosome maturation factor RimM [Gammaproteobacteria bacterium]